MLLHVELAGVEAPDVSKSGKLVSRKDLLKEFSCQKTAVHNQLLVATCEGSERVGRTATG